MSEPILTATEIRRRRETWRPPPKVSEAINRLQETVLQPLIEAVAKEIYFPDY